MHFEIGNPKFIPALKTPLIAIIIFYIMKKIFFFLYNKHAEDTFWSMDLSMMKDGIFNGLFWFLATMVPVFLIVYMGI